MSELLDDDWFDPSLSRIENANANKARQRWIATNGADLSGHDFGCEWIWLARDRKVIAILYETRNFCPTTTRLRAHASWWAEITHWMATDIETPEAP